MTQPNERYQSLKQVKRLLEELVDPGKTPRVPAIVRERARGALKHFPNELDIERLADSCPEVLDKADNNPYNRRLVNQK